MQARFAEGIMATRALSILALAAVVATVSTVCALAESSSDAMVKNRDSEKKAAEPRPYLVNPQTRPELTNPEIRPEVTLQCRSESGSKELRCTEVARATAPESIAKPMVKPESAFATSLSLHTANNLATKETTTKFLHGITGNKSLAQKAAPTFMRISKSLPVRYGLAAAVLGTGAIAIYGYLPGGDAKAATNPPAGNLTYILVGKIDPSGTYSAVAADKKP